MTLIDVETLVLTLKSRGVTLERKPEGGVRVHSPQPLEPELLEAVKAHKLEILALLSSSSTSISAWDKALESATEIVKVLNSESVARVELEVFVLGARHRKMFFPIGTARQLEQALATGRSKFPDAEEVVVWGIASDGWQTTSGVFLSADHPRAKTQN